VPAARRTPRQDGDLAKGIDLVRLTAVHRSAVRRAGGARTVDGGVPAAPGYTAELLRRVNAEQRVFLSGTSIDSRYTGRIGLLNHRTDRDRVDEAISALRRHGAALSA
jgi:hypothetical protein